MRYEKTAVLVASISFALCIASERPAFSAPPRLSSLRVPAKVIYLDEPPPPLWPETLVYAGAGAAIASVLTFVPTLVFALSDGPESPAYAWAIASGTTLGLSFVSIAVGAACWPDPPAHEQRRRALEQFEYSAAPSRGLSLRISF